MDDAVRAIRRGGVIGIPTDTVYGLACDPANTAAVSRIYAIKRRPDGLELTLLAASIADIEDDIELNPVARRIAETYWPGPLSIISPLRNRRWAIPRDGSTLMVRIPDHPITLALLRRTGPLATTSANRHGEPAADHCSQRGGSPRRGDRHRPRRRSLRRTCLDYHRLHDDDPSRAARRPDQRRRVALASWGLSSNHHGGAAITVTGIDVEIRPEARTGFSSKPAVRATDPELADLLEEELERQEDTLELIPSENIASVAVLEALGSWLNNKYAEGVPGKRYYGGCQVVDKVENLARDRAKALFGAEHANVQPHSGTEANMAVYASVLNPGDKVLGMALDQGGHLSHGSPVSFSGKIYHFEPISSTRPPESSTWIGA